MSSVGEFQYTESTNDPKEYVSGTVEAFGEDVDVHRFLFLRDGEVNDEVVRVAIPVMRQKLAEKPETAAMYRKKHISHNPSSRMGRDLYYEFAGTWVVPKELYSPGDSDRLYANPHHIHAYRYSDVFTECPCDGDAIVKTSYDSPEFLRDAIGEHENCKPYDRLRARANLCEQREDITLRLLTLGWDGSKIAPRIGFRTKSIGSLCRDFGYTVTEMKSDFRRLAGNTYVTLVHDRGYSPEDVAACYGYDRRTLLRYARDYGDISCPQ